MAQRHEIEIEQIWEIWMQDAQIDGMGSPKKGVSMEPFTNYTWSLKTEIYLKLYYWLDMDSI